MRQPVLDRHVDVAQLWRLAREAAGKGEKRGQRKKSVTDAMLGYYSHLRLDRRGAKQWVSDVVDVRGFFDPSADWPDIQTGLRLLDEADGDIAHVGAELHRLQIVPASAMKNSLFQRE